MTPCPYLPVFGGNLKRSSLAELWRDSEPFVRIRQRSLLGGRCGSCEFNRFCGGCRARAHGMSGDYMAEDPLCTHQPGTYPRPEITPPRVEYGTPAEPTIPWNADASDRMQRVPAFVRGMVIRAVEPHCRGGRPA